jgi:hypothetical protein
MVLTVVGSIMVVVVVVWQRALRSLNYRRENIHGYQFKHNLLDISTVALG